MSKQEKRPDYDDQAGIISREFDDSDAALDNMLRHMRDANERNRASRDESRIARRIAQIIASEATAADTEDEE